jgi:hypothetical protein
MCLSKSTAWLVSVYVNPLLSDWFYIVDSLDVAGRLDVYPKVEYLSACSREVRRLVDSGHLQPVEDVSQLGPPTAGFDANLRFFPKGGGRWRMICSFRRGDKQSRSRYRQPGLLCTPQNFAQS